MGHANQLASITIFAASCWLLVFAATNIPTTAAGIIRDGNYTSSSTVQAAINILPVTTEQSTTTTTTTATPTATTTGHQPIEPLVVETADGNVELPRNATTIADPDGKVALRQRNDEENAVGKTFAVTEAVAAIAAAADAFKPVAEAATAATTESPTTTPASTTAAAIVEQNQISESTAERPHNQPDGLNDTAYHNISSTEPSNRTTKRLKADHDPQLNSLLMPQHTSQASITKPAPPAMSAPRAVTELDNEITHMVNSTGIDGPQQTRRILNANVLESAGEKPVAEQRNSTILLPALDTSINEVQSPNATTPQPFADPKTSTARQSKYHEPRNMPNITNAMNINKGLMDWVYVHEQELSNSIDTTKANALESTKEPPVKVHQQLAESSQTHNTSAISVGRNETENHIQSPVLISSVTPIDLGSVTTPAMTTEMVTPAEVDIDTTTWPQVRRRVNRPTAKASTTTPSALPSVTEVSTETEAAPSTTTTPTTTTDMADDQTTGVGGVVVTESAQGTDKDRVDERFEVAAETTTEPLKSQSTTGQTVIDSTEKSNASIATSSNVEPANTTILPTEVFTEDTATTMAPIIVDTSMMDSTTESVTEEHLPVATTVVPTTSTTPATTTPLTTTSSTSTTARSTTTTSTTPTTTAVSSEEIDDSVEDMHITTFDPQHNMGAMVDNMESTLTSTTPATTTSTTTTTLPMTTTLKTTSALPMELQTTATIVAHEVIHRFNPDAETPEVTTPAPESVGGVQEEEPTDVNAIIAVSVSVVGVICLILLVGFLYVMRKRQKLLSYSQRCRPIGLDAYSLDNMSTFNSVRRKGGLQQSKRAYGNPAFDDHALKKHALTAATIGSFVTHRQEIYEEFKQLPTVTAHIDDVPAGCEEKNRFANILPLPETRCFLQPVGDDARTEYVNANYVKGPQDKSNYYIATQAPLENTVTDFWRLVWEQNSRVILMATDLIEDGVERCSEYLPSSVVLDNQLQFGDFHIELKSREVKDKYAVSTVHVRNTVSDTWREIVHVWYQWPAANLSGAPVGEEAIIVAMLLEVRVLLKRAPVGDDLGAPMAGVEAVGGKTKVNGPKEAAATVVTAEAKEDKDKVPVPNDGTTVKTRSLQRFQGPLTVHCSSGTGRTGTLIACDIAMRSLEQPAKSVDIPNIVYFVRNGRAGAVATREQYEFIYKLANSYAVKMIEPRAD